MQQMNGIDGTEKAKTTLLKGNVDAWNKWVEEVRKTLVSQRVI